MPMLIRSRAARRVAVASMLGALVVGVAGCSSDIYGEPPSETLRAAR
jgi:hypothetical protein